MKWKSHRCYKNILSLLCQCVFIYTKQINFFEKEDPHSSQIYGFSPVCVHQRDTHFTIWLFSMCLQVLDKIWFHEKEIQQILQEWFLSSIFFHEVPQIVFSKLHYQIIYIHTQKFLFLSSFPHFLSHITEIGSTEIAFYVDTSVKIR